MPATSGRERAAENCTEPGRASAVLSDRSTSHPRHRSAVSHAGGSRKGGASGKHPCETRSAHGLRPQLQEDLANCQLRDRWRTIWIIPLNLDVLAIDFQQVGRIEAVVRAKPRPDLVTNVEDLLRPALQR